ncbi:ankyrin repeat domain-containing protein [Tahibacter amnicola]|uniref:Ankyrin repeat domain-containing protein n=1 Tax=Tahibacter amnicola TaxID=2976241 RepID=A0ABY6BKB2_9GAMM|nr:ankyrin repeat domain-containing protein [Tahibacter amnicola]UXI70051.1 ankyrin repeat domain-containing protein [Tahibacter amnicola]
MRRPSLVVPAGGRNTARVSGFRVAMRLAMLLALVSGVAGALQGASRRTPGTEGAPAMRRGETMAIVSRARLALTPDNLVDPLLRGDVTIVEALLSAGVDVKARASMLQSPMQLAVSACANLRGQGQRGAASALAMIEVLLRHGAELDRPGPGGLTALMVAAQHCPGAVITRLVQAGADTSVRTTQGYTALSLALFAGNHDAAEVLLAAGARTGGVVLTRLMEGRPADARTAELIRRAGLP